MNSHAILLRRRSQTALLPLSVPAFESQPQLLFISSQISQAQLAGHTSELPRLSPPGRPSPSHLH